MLTFGAAPLQITLWVGLVCVPAGACRRGPRTERADPGGDDLGVNRPPGIGVQVAGFPNHRLGDPLAELARGELGEGFREVEPQRPGSAEPLRTGRRRDLARQCDLITDAAADRVRVHILGELLGHLGPGEADGLGRLERGGRGSELLQASYPVDPHAVGGGGAVGRVATQFEEEIVQSSSQRIGRRRARLDDGEC